MLRHSSNLVSVVFHLMVSTLYSEHLRNYSVLAGLIVKPVLTEDTSQRETLDLSRFWLGNCLENHHACEQSHLSSYFPARTLAIGDKDGREWRLHITEENVNPHEPYATLSHCWGSSVPLTLTKDSLYSFKRGQPVENLPRTFRDAVLVAKHLGIRYLWIDALFILQDSEEDWAKESPQMLSIYSNRRCNIAASRATNTPDGCFSKRDPALIAPTVVIPEWKGCSGFQYNICDVGWFLEHQLSNQSLHHRAWVVQERLMGPRQNFFWTRSSFLAMPRRNCFRVVASQHPEIHIHIEGNSLDEYL